jgi:hypothetical protein
MPPCGHQEAKDFAMHPTRNDLPARSRTRLESLRTHGLADSSDLLSAPARDLDRYPWFLEGRLQGAR